MIFKFSGGLSDRWFYIFDMFYILFCIKYCFVKILIYSDRTILEECCKEI